LLQGNKKEALPPKRIYLSVRPDLAINIGRFALDYMGVERARHVDVRRLPSGSKAYVRLPQPRADNHTMLAVELDVAELIALIPPGVGATGAPHADRSWAAAVSITRRKSG
jgi:hypothetical protein